MYETALANSQDTIPEEVVYLNDREPLVIAASKLGIHGMHVTDHATAISKVHKLQDTA
jgi:FMN phosphatase YigB (HAD superfamily)